MFRLIAVVSILFTIYTYAEIKISIITSLYKGEKFIEHFLEDIAKQTIYDQCEHIIINANSPENEEPIILDFCKNHTNVRYYRLEKDPGLYGVWNLAINLSNGEYITNANVDDRYCYTSLEELLLYIEHFPEIDLVYPNHAQTLDANTPFHECSFSWLLEMPEFSLESLITYCTPGNHPLWRKNLHKKIGFFDKKFKIVGDYEFWIRAYTKGIKFKKYPKFLGVLYVDDRNLSFSKDKDRLRKYERMRIRKKYKKIWPQ